MGLLYSRGIVLAAGAQRWRNPSAERPCLKTSRPWVRVAMFAPAAALCYWWFKQQFAALGYTA